MLANQKPMLMDRKLEAEVASRVEMKLGELKKVFEQEVSARVGKEIRDQRIEFEVNARVAAQPEKERFEFEVRMDQWVLGLLVEWLQEPR